MAIAVEAKQTDLGLSILAHVHSSSGNFIPLLDTGPSLSSFRNDIVVIISKHLSTEGQHVRVEVLLKGVVQPLGLLIVMRVVHVIVFVLYWWTE